MVKKIRTVIASVLKPVDDSRMYEKIGLSLQQTNRYDVNIIGFASKKNTALLNIRQIGLFSFGRKSLKRIWAPVIFLRWLIKLRPQLVIVTTFELLWPAVLYKSIFSDTRVIYDIQENYKRNACANQTFGTFSIQFANLISFIEKFCQRAVSLNLLAEPAYLHELNWLSRPSFVILNKYKKVSESNGSTVDGLERAKKIIEDSYPVIIFSGTISENYGIRDAINLTEHLSNNFSNIVLVVIGHLADAKLLNLIANSSLVLNLSALQPVPHTDILQLMKLADFGIVAHRPVESIRNCFPTRIYELMAHKLPVLVRNHPLWSEYCLQRDAGIVVDFDNIDATAIARKMKTGHFYRSGIPNDIYWSSEEKKLIQAIDKFFDISN